MQLALVIYYGLAVWRLSHLVCKEDGPGDLLIKIRKVVTFSGLLDCVWCASIWASAGFTLLYWLSPATAQIIAAPLTLSAVAVIVERHMEVQESQLTKG